MSNFVGLLFPPNRKLDPNVRKSLDQGLETHFLSVWNVSVLYHPRPNHMSPLILIPSLYHPTNCPEAGVGELIALYYAGISLLHENYKVFF